LAGKMQQNATDCSAYPPTPEQRKAKPNDPIRGSSGDRA